MSFLASIYPFNTDIMTICHKNKLHNFNTRIRQLLQIMKNDDLAITCLSCFVVTEYTLDIHYQYNLSLVLFCTPSVRKY